MRITPATDSDHAFIYSSWLRCYLDGLKERGDAPSSEQTYYRSQSALIKELLESSTILVARSPVDDLVIRGYVVAEPGELHWVYVKSVCRRQGIATALLKAAGEPTKYTHAREPGAEWLRRRGMSYDGRFFG